MKSEKIHGNKEIASGKKSEILQDSIGGIRDDYIRDAHKKNAVSMRKAYQVKWGVVAACVCFVVLGLIVSNNNGNNGSLKPSGNREIYIADNTDKNNTDKGTTGNTEIDTPKVPKTNTSKYDNEKNTQAQISADSLLLDSGEIEETLILKEIPVGKYTAVYENVESVGSETLKNCIGNKLKKSNIAFYILGHEDLEYIIIKEKKSDKEDGKHSQGDEFSLWKFYNFKSEKYPYKDVLNMIYNIKDEQDIETVTVSPGEWDGTDEGVKLRKKIGTFKITKQNEIKKLYKVLNSMECYGSDKWELIDYGAKDNDMSEATRQGRRLTLNISNGCRADRLIYTGVSGMFFEYGGIAYNKLKGKDNDKIKKMLKIG